MIKIGDGKRRTVSVALAALAGGLLLFLACETPTPPETAGAQASPRVASEPTPADGSQGTVRKLPPENGGEEGTARGVYHLQPMAEGGQEGLPPLIHIDGHRVEGGKAALERLNPDEIDRIEVIKGKAAEVAFGEAAAGGVIRVFLKK